MNFIANYETYKLNFVREKYGLLIGTRGWLSLCVAKDFDEMEFLAPFVHELRKFCEVSRITNYWLIENTVFTMTDVENMFIAFLKVKTYESYCQL